MHTLVRRYGLVLAGALAVAPGACGPPPPEPAPPPPQPADPDPDRVAYVRDRLLRNQPLDYDDGRVLRRRPDDRRADDEADLLALGENLDPLLAAFLADPNTGPRRVVRGLEFFQRLPSRPLLRDLAVAHLSHEDPRVRSAALLAVGSVGTEADLAAVLPFLDNVGTGGPRTRPWKPWPRSAAGGRWWR